MKNIKAKLIAFASITLLAGSAMAQSTSATMDVGGAVSSGCTFGANSYNVDFGNVLGGTVGKAQTNIEVVCSNGTPYVIYPNQVEVNDGVTFTKITVYSDPTRTTQLTPSLGIGRNGTGALEQIPLYFRLNSSMGGPELTPGEGAVLASAAGTLNTTIGFTVTF